MGTPRFQGQPPIRLRAAWSKGKSVAVPNCVDVRDMLCAQALAVAAQAVTRLNVGGSLDILLNAEDVRHDLLVWARERALVVHESAPGVLKLQRS